MPEDFYIDIVVALWLATVCGFVVRWTSQLFRHFYPRKK